MKRQYIILLTGLLVACLAFAFTSIRKNENKKTTVGKGFALVELYTSEGCSSCPPADKLIAKIAQEYKDKEVYILAYHVDYWNYLGWKDVFSSPQYSARQREYAAYLKSPDGVYTPQAIVNGKTEFIGSEEGKMQAAIKQALAKPSATSLILNAPKITGNKATINYKVVAASGNSLLQLAVIKNHSETQVKAGENNGRNLPHINIVQKFSTMVLNSDTGTAGINLPEGFNTKDWTIIAFIQNSHTGEITAVQNAAVENKEMAAVK